MQSDAWLYSGAFQDEQIRQPDLDRSCEQSPKLLGFGILGFRPCSPHFFKILGIDDLESHNGCFWNSWTNGILMVFWREVACLSWREVACLWEDCICYACSTSQCGGAFFKPVMSMEGFLFQNNPVVVWQRAICYKGKASADEEVLTCADNVGWRWLSGYGQTTCTCWYPSSSFYLIMSYYQDSIAQGYLRLSEAGYL